MKCFPSQASISVAIIVPLAFTFLFYWSVLPSVAVTCFGLWSELCLEAVEFSDMTLSQGHNCQKAFTSLNVMLQCLSHWIGTDWYWLPPGVKYLRWSRPISSVGVKHFSFCGVLLSGKKPGFLCLTWSDSQIFFQQSEIVKKCLCNFFKTVVAEREQSMPYFSAKCSVSSSQIW